MNKKIINNLPTNCCVEVPCFIDTKGCHPQKIGFLPEQSARAKIYKGKGCDHCNKSGYKGRMGVYEILEVTKELKQGILSNLGQNELEALAKKGGFKTMHSMGHDLLLSGDLSFAEYERILSRG